MWKWLRDTARDVQRISNISVRTPIVVGALSALTYYWSLRWDYVATVLTGVGVAAGGVASVAKNLQELLGSIELERDLHKQHAMVKKYLEQQSADMPPLPIGLIGSDFYNNFMSIAPQGVNPAEQHVPALQRFDAEAGAAQRTTHQKLRGITHYEKSAMTSYAVSIIIGSIVALVLTYRLVTCNREEEPDSSLPDCYNTFDTILIVIVIVTMLVLTAVHSTIAGDLRRWRTSLERSQRALNEYVAEQFEKKLTGRLGQSRAALHEATKGYLKPDAEQSLAIAPLPPNVFAALDAIDQLTNERKAATSSYIQELRDGFAAEKRQLEEQRKKDLAAKEKQYAQLKHFTQFFIEIKSMYGELIDVEHLLGAMQVMLAEHKTSLAQVTQQAAQARLAELLATQPQQEQIWHHRQQDLRQRQIQLKQRLLTLTTRANDAKMHGISEDICRELSIIRDALRSKISLV